jgi:hypothetical protein
MRAFLSKLALRAESRLAIYSFEMERVITRKIDDISLGWQVWISQ